MLKKFFYYLSNYTNLNNSQELTYEEQLFLRLWYRKERNILTGWVTYWVKLAHHNPEFFIKNCYKICDLDGYTDQKVNPWRDIISILNGLLLTPRQPEECIEKLYLMIINELSENIIELDNNLLAQALPLTNKKMRLLYNNLVSYCGQTHKDWRETLKELRTTSANSPTEVPKPFPAYSFSISIV